MKVSTISSIDAYLVEVEQRDSLQGTIPPNSANRQRQTPDLSSEYLALSSDERASIARYREGLASTTETRYACMGVVPEEHWGGFLFLLHPSAEADAAHELERPSAEADAAHDLERPSAEADAAHDLERPSAEADAAYDFERLKSMSIPGVRALAALDAERAEAFQSVVDIEKAAAGQARPGTYNNAVILQTVYIEGLLELLLQGTPTIADAILERLESCQSAIVQRAYSDGRQTLGSLQLICIGLHRAIRAGATDVLAWIAEVFQPVVSRHAGEQASMRDRLSTGNLARTLGRLREQYRNPLIHSQPGVTVTGDGYRRFCDLAYATRDLRQWMDLGVNPAYYAPSNLGWVSLLVSGAKRGGQHDGAQATSSGTVGSGAAPG